MPDPCKYDSESDFVSACISARQDENPNEDTDQSTAICYQMWRDRDCDKAMKQKKSPEGVVHKAGTTISVGEREAVFIASTDSPDRHGDVVEQNWDFKDFKKNPVLLFQHDHRSLPIGRVKKLWTDGGKTFAHTEATPEGWSEVADKVWRFIKGGFLNAVSVGFLPLEPPQDRYDKDGNWEGWTFPKVSLLELSVVSVPANQEALAVAKSLDLTQHDIEQIFETPKACTPRANAARRYAQIERMRVGIK